MMRRLAMTACAFPTAMVPDLRGQVVSRLSGYVPDRNVETLSGHVSAALDGK
jgi:hypothetical protein